MDRTERIYFKGWNLQFLGRNGTFSEIGLHVSKHADEKLFRISPITSKDKIASGFIEIPEGYIHDLAHLLTYMKEAQ